MVGSDNVWKLLFVAVLATLLSGVGSWLMFGHDRVGRADMENYVQNGSPWMVDQRYVQGAIRGNTENISKLESVVARIVDAQQQLLVEQRVLVTKVEQLVEETRR